MLSESWGNSVLGYINKNQSIVRADYSEDKAAIDKEVAITHLVRETKWATERPYFIRMLR